MVWCSSRPISGMPCYAAIIPCFANALPVGTHGVPCLRVGTGADFTIAAVYGFVRVCHWTAGRFHHQPSDGSALEPRVSPHRQPLAVESQFAQQSFILLRGKSRRSAALRLRRGRRNLPRFSNRLCFHLRCEIDLRAECIAVFRTTKSLFQQVLWFVSSCVSRIILRGLAIR